MANCWCCVPRFRSSARRKRFCEEAIKDVQLQIQLVQDATRDAESVKQKRIAEKAQTEQELARLRPKWRIFRKSVGTPD